MEIYCVQCVQWAESRTNIGFRCTHSCTYTCVRDLTLEPEDVHTNLLLLSLCVRFSAPLCTAKMAVLALFVSKNVSFIAYVSSLPSIL